MPLTKFVPAPSPPSVPRSKRFFLIIGSNSASFFAMVASIMPPMIACPARLPASFQSPVPSAKPLTTSAKLDLITSPRCR